MYYVAVDGGVRLKCIKAAERKSSTGVEVKLMALKKKILTDRPNFLRTSKQFFLFA